MTYKTISPQDAKKLLDSDNAVLIDVREKDEYDALHIPGAILIPLGEMSIDKLPNLKNKTLLIHCKSGRRSVAACEKLSSENADLEVFSVEGGIEAWRKEGFPTRQQHVNHSIPIMRQVSIVAGSLIFLGIILSQFLSPKFMILSEIVAFGLIFSGITGWCGMAMLLARMPWNKKS